MARAQRTTEIVRQPKRVKRIQLTLTEGEADFLLAVMAYIGGDKRKSPRKYAQRIRQALEKALGIDFHGTDAYPLSYGLGVTFNDYPDPKAGSETVKPNATAPNTVIYQTNVQPSGQLDPKMLDEAIAKWKRAYGINPRRPV